MSIGLITILSESVDIIMYIYISIITILFCIGYNIYTMSYTFKKKKLNPNLKWSHLIYLPTCLII